MSKEEFIKEISDEGYNAGFNESGIPTVFVEDPNTINDVCKAIKVAIKKVGYNQSYSITLTKIKQKS